VGRLHRFPDHRFVGRRDLMIVYDCDDQTQLRDLEASVRDLDLERKDLLQSFAPDDQPEAANRGFRPAGSAEGGP
jgi:hypothetical protein